VQVTKNMSSKVDKCNELGQKVQSHTELSKKREVPKGVQ
jgi:hypothetical protein